MDKKQIKKPDKIYPATFLLLVSLFLFMGCSHKESQIYSPNGKIRVIYTNTPQPSFTIFYHENENLDIWTEVVTLPEIGLLTGRGNGKAELINISEPRHVTENYTMLQGKRSICSNEATEYVFRFKTSDDITMDIIFRAYNDGVAFRYSFPEEEDILIRDELTTYQVSGPIKRWTQQLESSYEGFYPMNTDGIGGNEKREWGYPALFEVSGHTWMLITEAGIERGDCGSWLTNQRNPSAYKVQPAEKEWRCPAGWQSPWRVLIIGELSGIVESTLVTDVSAPCRLTDTSWINPGMISWIYWAYNHGSKDFQIVRKYIDFAVEMNLPYVLIDWEWDEMENGGGLQDALRYAKEKGIKPLLWYNSSTAWIGKNAPGPLFRLNDRESRNKEFEWLSEQGVKGIKVDFFNQDSISTMNYFIDILEDAAQYQLMINLHGATIPRGWQRTYPNMMTVEGVYGAEWYNNNPVLTDNAAWHNATLPFTRNVVGPMDYTPCTFTDSQHPHITSHGHELALLVLFESAWQHLADRPEGYLSQPQSVRSFITELPTTWDDTKLICGYPSEYIVLARRKGNVWYIAGLNGTDQQKQLSFKLDFIEKPFSEILLFSDGSEGDVFDIKTIPINKEGYSINCLPNGGFVMVIR